MASERRLRRRACGKKKFSLSITNGLGEEKKKDGQAPHLVPEEEDGLAQGGHLLAVAAGEVLESTNLREGFGDGFHGSGGGGGGGGSLGSLAVRRANHHRVTRGALAGAELEGGRGGVDGAQRHRAARGG